MYQTYAFNMCWVTYFDTITHPYQNLRTLSELLRTPAKSYAPLEKEQYYFIYQCLNRAVKRLNRKQMLKISYQSNLLMIY